MHQLIPQNDRRANEREPVTVPTTIQLTLLEADGRRSIVAQILSISYSGLGVTCNQALSPGTKLAYVHPVRPKSISARIAWCKQNETHGFEHGIANESFDAGSKVDHYTVLQVSVTAEPSTIDAAYDRLGQRYHSSNSAASNPELFERVVEAYNVLSDPEKRTAYDSERSSAAKHSTPGEKVERNRELIRRKRYEILDLLYWRRVESPYKPVITVHEFETILKISKEQMEFNFWFLRDKGYVIRNDNASFFLTSEGVAAVEAAEEAGLMKPAATEADETASVPVG